MLRDKALQKKGLIDVTAENFPEIIKTDRDSWLVLLFTSYPPSIACPFCVEFRPIYNILVQNWLRQYKGRNGAPFFFSTIEFKNGDSVFQEVIPMKLRTVHLIRFLFRWVLKRFHM